MINRRTAQFFSAIKPHFLPGLLMLGVLLMIYCPVLQTQINGADHYFTADVGEIQIALNTWGTLHPTGYPLYTLGSSALVSVFRAIGVNPADAASLTSLLWGIVALILLYALLVHISNRRWLAALLVILFGLVRTVWVHQVIAEVYTFGLILLLALLCLALWRTPIKGRILWLALLGGLAIDHHRAIGMVAPALIYAVWPELKRKIMPNAKGNSWSASMAFLTFCLLLGLVGIFVPYVYIWLRSIMGAAWLFGDTTTLHGLWELFSGVEAERYIGLMDSWVALRANLAMVNAVLIRDLTLLGMLAGVLGLLVGLGRRSQRRVPITMILNAIVPYLFHAFFYSDILSALILPVIVSVVFGWLLLCDALIRFIEARHFTGWQRSLRWAWVPLAFVFGVVLLEGNGPFIAALTSDDEGLAFIDIAEQAPAGSSLMIACGVYYFAVAYAQQVDPSIAAPALQHVVLIPHDGDLAGAASDGMLLTPSFTFYNQNADWWAERLGTAPVLQAVAPELIQIMTAPVVPINPPDTFGPIQEDVICMPESIILDVTWHSPDIPSEDLSVFVHVFDAAGNFIGQDDQFAPVYGLRPLTSWQPGEAVRDVYEVVVPPEDATSLRYGFYRITSDGFEHVLEYDIANPCPS